MPSIESVRARVEQLIDAATADDLRSHRLETLAARRYRETGRPVPADFADKERMAAIASMTTPHVLEAVANAYGRSLIVIKGPTVAALYPEPAVRGYWDIDLVAKEPQKAWDALLRGGFHEVGDPELFVNIHHLRPLAYEGLFLPVEIHSRLKWLDGERGPSAAELWAAARPDPALHGFLTLPPAHRVAILAVHSWSHEPLRRLRDILDIALALSCADGDEVASLSEEWGVGRLWRRTRAVIESVGGVGRPPIELRTWARNLGTARERTVLENHLERWFSDFSVLPPTRAVSRLPANVLHDFRRENAEPWPAKVRRTLLAVRHARRARSAHEDELRARQSPD